MKLKSSPLPNKNTFAFVCSAGAGILIVVFYASLWWWAKIKVKLTTTGVERIFHDQPKIWRYDRIKGYHFESLCSEADFYTLLVLQNHRGKTLKIALDDTIDKTKIEDILNEHEIPKNEKVTYTKGDGTE